MKWSLGFGLVLCFVACLGFMAAPAVTGLAYDTLPSEGGFVADGVVCEYGCACDARSAFSTAPEVADFGQPSLTNAALLGYMTPGESRARLIERELVAAKRAATMNAANLARLDERCTRLERLLAQFSRQSTEQQESETLACRRGRRGRRGASCGAYETSHAAEMLAVASCDHDDAS
ncbi:MAG: hypothetical protein E6Q97_20090 [Desulfurellales bacterium]|nr:MAG: hypothetical protein E6Q97_20090 [Desulfurellales bacterium]